MSGWLSGLLRRVRGRPRQGVQLRAASAVHLGTSYGGYAILPERITAQSIVYSFGIGEDVSFDTALIERFGCTVHGFDPTPRSIAWVQSQGLSPKFVMHGVGLADYDGVASFAPPKNPAHISHSLLADAAASTEGERVEFQVKRLDTLMAELGHARIDVLKMDIEGAEYGVIDALVASTVRPDQLLLEFHHKMHGIPVSRTERAIEQLNAAGYVIFDAQPTGREFSLLRQP
jgi:FkbM family methyltransferase